MAHTPALDVPRWALQILNNLYEIDRKLASHGDAANIARNVERIRDSLGEQGLFYEDPMGQRFRETRSDLEATISGDRTDNLFVVDVIKPIIRGGNAEFSRVIQKGIVVVQSSDNGEST